MITTNDMEYKFDLNKDIAFIVVQPEHPPTKHLHQQAYVEFRSQLAGNAVNKAMGFPIFKKGEKSENGYYHNEGRFGTQEKQLHIAPLSGSARPTTLVTTVAIPLLT